MITEFIAEKINQPIIDELNDVTYQWKMFNSGGVETVVGEFLYSLVRLVKPDNVCETGTYQGFSSCYIGLALKENNKGHLDTIEIESQHIESAKEKWQKLDIQKWITVYQLPSLDFKLMKDYDILFLDSEPWLRFSELNKFWPRLKLGGLILIHDLHYHLGERISPWEDFVTTIGSKIKNHELTVISFVTPRGLVLMRKFKEDDGAYKLLKEKIK